MTAVPSDGAYPSDGAHQPDGSLTEDDAAFEGPLFDAFAAVAARQPDHLAVDDGTDCLTYADLRERALALGARIAAVVPVDALVGVIVPTTVLYPVAWLACLAARRPFLPFDPHLPPARINAIVADARVAAAIVAAPGDALATTLPADLPLIPILTTSGPISTASGPILTPSGIEPVPLPVGLPPSRVGMVQFTSGSTGSAKGIALHESAMQRKASSNWHLTCELGPNDRLMSVHSPSTSAGTRDTFGALLYGASLHPLDLKRDGLARVPALLSHACITVCAVGPSVARALMAIDGAADAFRGVRLIRLGTETIMGCDIAGLARLLRPTARILVSFGMTEAGGGIMQRLVDPHAPVDPGRVAIGSPLPGDMVSVEDANGHPVKPGEIGELVIRGRYVALGQWVAGRLDPTAFPAEPSAPEIRCYRSGDMVLLRQDGMLDSIGRADRQVKINGVRVEPGDTEAALRGLQGVTDAAVLVHGDPDAPMLVAFVVPVPGERKLEPTPQTAARMVRGWRTALAAVLPPQQVPTRIRVVSAIPLLPSLKPDLDALRGLLSEEDTTGVLTRVWTRLRGAKSRRA